MNWQTIMDLERPTETQIKLYCRENNIDYQAVFCRYENIELMGRVLSELGRINLLKNGLVEMKYRGK